jgi:hypothetical protein
MSARILHAVALTPVHVEDPAPWTPDAFALDDDHLVMFDPAAAMAALDPAARQGFSIALDRGDVRLAQDVLRAGLRPELMLDRILVGAASRAGILEAFANPARPARVVRFARSGTRPCLPGSTIKGALRTALLSARAEPLLPELRRIAARDEARTGRTGRLSDEIQREVFGFDPAAPVAGQDPFRRLRVADCLLGEGSTRIDRVFNRRRDGRTKDMLVDVELMRAGTVFELAIAVDAAAGEGIGDLDSVLAACDGFNRRRWDEERTRFYADTPWPAQPATGEGWRAVLLRVGRYAHFEAASIDGLRQGWNHARREAMVVGDSRAVTLRDRLPVPFGWLALCETAEAAQVLAAEQRALAEPPPRPPRPPPVPVPAAAPGPRPGKEIRPRKDKPRREAAPGADAGKTAGTGAQATRKDGRPGDKRRRDEGGRRPRDAAPPPPPPPPPARTSRLLMFRRGERVRDPASGETAIVAIDVPLGATRMEVDFPDGPMSVDPKGWRKA